MAISCARDTCGHLIRQHQLETGSCNVAGCSCVGFLEYRGMNRFETQRDWELEVLTNIIDNSDVSHEALQFFPDYILLITKAMLKARKEDE